MKEIFTGRCQCEEIAYRVTGESLALFICHCTDCQRQSASAFGMALWVTHSAVTLLSGELKTWTRLTPSGREMHCQFCPTCGSRIFHSLTDQPEIISIKPGTLDDVQQLEPVGHIWTQSAQTWVAVDDACLAYPENPDTFAEMIARWRLHKSQ